MKYIDRRHIPLLVLAALLAAPAGAQQVQVRTTRCRDCDSTRAGMQALEAQIDSLNRELTAMRRKVGNTANDDERRELQGEIMETTARRTALTRRLTTLQRTTGNTDLARRAEEARLFEELARAQTTGAGGTPQAAVRGGLMAPVRLPQAPGYLGVTYSGQVVYRGEGSELFVEHSDWPVIVSVEPRSPAARAGLSSGDTVIAYNGFTLRGNRVSLSRLLKPGDTLTVKVRRDNNMRDVPVVVGRRPGTFVAAPTTGQGGWISVEPDVVLLTPGQATGATTVIKGRVATSPPSPASAPPSRTVPVSAPARTPLPPVGFSYTVTNSVAGADLQRVRGDLAEVFGVDRGVLVLDVQRASLAERAGLRGGDVILEAGGEKVYLPLHIHEALQRVASERRLELLIVRKKKQQTVTLDWSGTKDR